jgi:glycosyltransferase involved in cell wall biosynthesis
VFRDRAEVCSDAKNLAWGRLRNSLADYQCLLGGNRADFNDDPRVHESPWFYCLDRQFWNPDLLVPSNYRLPFAASTIKLYHSVGNFELRSSGAGKVETIKSTHIYIPLIERLRREGHDVELVFFKDVPNKKIRYYQVQADVVLEMLTFGWFGANAREAMMLGKPVICFLRPEWLESMRRELPEYVDELPILSATPETVYDVLRDLLENPQRRAEIGRRSRAFAEKWHASDVAAAHFDKVFHEVLGRQAEPRDVSFVR